MADPKSELIRVMSKYNAAFFCKNRTNPSIYKESLMKSTKVLDAQTASFILLNYKFSSQLVAENATYLFNSETSTVPSVLTITGGKLSIKQEKCRDELTRLKGEISKLKDTPPQSPAP